MPYYDIDEFIKSCKNAKENIICLKKVKTDSIKFFGIKDPIEFIANRGCDNLKFINSKEWENNKGIIVDGYKFETHKKSGYLAFGKKGNKRIIKSFHRGFSISESDFLYSPFKILGGNNGE